MGSSYFSFESKGIQIRYVASIKERNLQISLVLSINKLVTIVKELLFLPLARVKKDLKVIFRVRGRGWGKEHAMSLALAAHVM